MDAPHAAYRLPHRLASGSWQMAADAALLDWVSLGPARLVFRTYGWDRPTLSLGRSEPFPAGWDERALSREGIAVARRPTGGNAVLHWEEVTFALAATLPGPCRLTPRGFANEAAEALAEALRGCGVNAARVDAATPRPAPARPGEAPCFARIESGRLFVREASCPNLVAEAGLYRYGDTAAARTAEAPVDAHNHALSALRYLISSLDDRHLASAVRAPPRDRLLPVGRSAGRGIARVRRALDRRAARLPVARRRARGPACTGPRRPARRGGRGAVRGVPCRGSVLDARP